MIINIRLPYTNNNNTYSFDIGDGKELEFTVTNNYDTKESDQGWIKLTKNGTLKIERIK